MIKTTACARLALFVAAAIATAAVGRLAAVEPGPETAATASTANRPTPTPAAESGAKGKKRDTYPFRGVIGSVDIQARTLTLVGKQTRRVIQVTEATRLEKSDKGAAVFDDLKTGERIGGTLKKSAAGVEEALLIRLGAKSGSDPTEDGESAGAAKDKAEDKDKEDGSGKGGQP
jgi:hypothetical protein